MDVVRAAGGMRALPLAVWGRFGELPPVSALALSGCLTALAWNPAGYCQTQLLAGVLSSQRQAGAAALLEHLGQPLAAFVPVAAHLTPSPALLEGSAPPAAVCHATASFLHLSVGLVLPCLLAAWRYQRPHNSQQPSAGPEAGQAGGGVNASSTSTSGTAWVQQALRRAAAACNCWLHTLLGGRQVPAARALVAWFVCANLWLLCKLSAGL